MSSWIVKLFPISCVIFLLIFYKKYADTAFLLPEHQFPQLSNDKSSSFDFTQYIHPMKSKDFLPMILITAVYAVFAFSLLGENVAPTSVCYYEDAGRYTLIELTEPTTISRVQYFTGIHTGDYTLQFSEDGENFVDQIAMPQSYADLFKWMDAELNENQTPIRFVRIVAQNELELREIALYDNYHRLIPPDMMIYDDGTVPLLDEQELVPKYQTFLNSTYFDEIYHARTAYENVANIYPYEVSHPPLGKLIISLGIRAFGMNPFGWRFMGVLFGILMMPLMYIFIKNMFGSTAIASCGLIIFGFDFMHFVQTRIATIDTYAVFFTILMYYFMYRYVSMDTNKHSGKRLILLMLSGIFFGLGAASKWTCIYAGGGLALIWLLKWIFQGMNIASDTPAEKSKFKNDLIKNIFWCVLFFVIIPAGIYYVSYYPYGKALGLSGPSMFFNPEYAKTVLENQKFMFSYHSGVDAEHPYSSRWYQWIFNIRPILYYLESGGGSLKSAFGAFLNPMLCWGGLFAMISVTIQAIRKRDGKALFIVVGYLAQLLPWLPVSRIVFEYHYFPCTVFLTLALCYVFITIKRQSARWKPWVYSFTAITAVLFLMFYPVLSGLQVPRAYTTNVLQWFSSWPF